MDEHKNNIEGALSIYRVHMVLYIIINIFAIQMVWVSTGITFYVGLGVLIYFICMMIIESVAVHDEQEEISMNPPLFIFYRSTQIVVAILLYLVAANKYCSVLGATIFIVYAMEILYYIDFEDIMRRVMFYVIMIVSFLTAAFVWTLCQRTHTLEDHFQLSLSSVFVSVVLIMFGEALAKIWKYYQYRLLEQKRNLERLEDYNRNLKEHRDKLSKVNELLGLQKVQLQTANRRINNAHKEMVVQNEIASMITGSIDLERMTEDICGLLYDKMELDYVCVVLEPLTKVGEDTDIRAGRTYGYRSTKGDEFALNVWKEIQNGTYDYLLDINCTYIENQGRRSRTIEYLGSVISVPLMRNIDRIGNLIVGKSETNAFAHGCEFYETIGGQIGVGITSALLYQQMEDMAIRDGLTGIYNRRYLTEIFTAKVEEAKRHNTPVSLALFDIDKFKMINDTYGHPFGDVVIRYVAQILDGKAMENGGIAGRYGGEEFVIAFPGLGADETYQLVSQVQDEIRNGSIEFHGEKVSVRLSAGIACYPETCNKSDDLLTRADWAMYHSKRNGRDQITIDSDQISSEM